MKVSIIIVSFNTRSLLRDCLESLQRNSPICAHEICIVDNGSTDGSVEMVHTDFAYVRLIENTQNVGFARANNQALEVARGEYVLLLNSDTRVPPGAVDELCAFADAHPAAAVVGSKLLWPDGSAQASSGAFPNLVTVFSRSLGLKRLVPIKNRRRLYALAAPLMGRTVGGYMANYSESDEPREVDRVGGACMLVRCAAIAQVGLLDENFFMYVEDIDWCRRFRAQGWKVYYLPRVKVLHFVGRSAEGDGLASEISLARLRSLLYYFRKHHGRVQSLIVQILITLSFSGSVFKQVFSRKRPARHLASFWLTSVRQLWR